jgi:hypothetical protein
MSEFPEGTAPIATNLLSRPPGLSESSALPGSRKEELRFIELTTLNEAWHFPKWKKLWKAPKGIEGANVDQIHNTYRV